ncbi:MAG: response regulator [Bacteroidota bacterium]
METSAQYEHILEGITGGFFALDKDYNFTYWNRAAEEGTGLKRDDVLGKNVFDIFPNARNAEQGERYRLAMETHTLQIFESSYKDDRFEKWYDIRVYPAEDGISVFFQDISDVKRRQKQKEILMEISRAINNAQYLDELCLTAGERIAQFMDVPSKFVCIYRYDPRSNMLHLMAPSLADVRVNPMVEHQIVNPEVNTITVQTALTKETIVTDELSRSGIAAHFLSEVNDLKFKSLLSVPLLVQNDLQGVLEVFTKKESGYVQDEEDLLSIITNELAIGMSRKRLMYEITIKNIELENEKKKTDDANETLKRFLATFSHELRAPLNSIVGFSEILAADFEKLPEEKVLDFMKAINVSGRHLQSLINDILDLSKIEAGRMELHLEAYPIAYFTDTVQRVLQNEIQKKQLNLTMEISPDVESLVVDQTRFRQILVNLLSNAVKYSRAGGNIFMNIRRIDNEIEGEIRDEGVGIRQEDLVKLFRPFQQGKNSEMVSEGTGLGLVITKKLIELHGGRISVESEFGKGTAFRFRIPMVLPGDVLESPAELLRIVEGQNLTAAPEEKPLVLIIEDNPFAAQLLQTYLQEAGYRTEVATNGLEGLEKAKQFIPSIITLDVFMPLKDGWQVLKELKLHPVCRHIPIIIISISDEKKLGFGMGAVDYFVKPVNREDLLNALSRLPIRASGLRRHPKVLVIDDDKTAIDLIEVILEAEGYDVIKTMNGKEGVRAAALESPDLIILDLIMPDVSGFNVAYQLKQQQETKDTPVIVLTSMEVDDETREKMHGFISGIMSKGRFTKKDLLREINMVQKIR